MDMLQYSPFLWVIYKSSWESNQDYDSKTQKDLHKMISVSQQTSESIHYLSINS